MPGMWKLSQDVEIEPSVLIEQDVEIDPAVIVLPFLYLNFHILCLN